MKTTLKILLPLLLLLTSTAHAATSQLTENGDGTATLTMTFQTFNWMSACRAFGPQFKSCGDTLDWDADGVDEQWAVDGGHCTQQEADDGVLVKDAAAYGSPTCTGANLTQNRCRGPEDPGVDQTDYVIEKPSVCQDYLRAIFTHNLRLWRNAGYRLLEQDNIALDEISGPIED